MKNLFLLFILAAIIFSFSACKSETVTLNCDGENCTNTVEVKIENSNKPDESWVVFCQSCADNVLAE